MKLNTPDKPDSISELNPSGCSVGSPVRRLPCGRWGTVTGTGEKGVRIKEHFWTGWVTWETFQRKWESGPNPEICGQATATTDRKNEG